MKRLTAWALRKVSALLRPLGKERAWDLLKDAKSDYKRRSTVF